MTILFLILLLFALMVLLGGHRGSVAFVVLLGDVLLCFVGTLLLSYGVNPIAVLAVGSLLFLILTVPVQNGLNPKTLAVLLSSAVLLIPVAVLVGVVCMNAHLVGLDEFQAAQTENSYLSSGVNLNLAAITMVSLVLGELGAITDTSMTVASSLYEIHVNQPNLEQKELAHIGMQIGRNLIGTTINTLAFIAFGETVMLCLLYIADGYSLTVLLNSKSFFQQFGGILLSCESCLLVIPLTVQICLIGIRSKRAAAFWQRHQSPQEPRS